MKIKNFISILMMGMIFLTYVSASLGVFEQNQCVNIRTILNTTSVNISTISFPNSSMIIINQEMEKNGQTFNYSFCNTNSIGVYVYDYFDLSGDVYVNDFEITPSGKKVEPGESLIYFILAFGVLLLFVLSFYFMIATPYENEVNQKGAVIKITKLKYVKLGLILLTWVLFTWFLNILIGLSDNFVNLTMYYGFFGFIFLMMNNLAIPLGLFILVICFFEIIRDFDLYENIKKLGSALQ